VRATSALRAVAGLPGVARLVRALVRIAPAHPDHLTVLTFHRVTADRAAVPGLHSATPDSFRHLLDLLAESFRIIGLDPVLARAGGGPALSERSLLLTFDDGYADLATEAWPALVERGLPGVAFIPTAFPSGAIDAFWWERGYAAIRASGAHALVAGGRSLPLGSPAERREAWRVVRDELKSLPNDELPERLEALERELGFDAASRPPASGQSLTWPELTRLRSEGLALASHTRTHPLLTRVEPSRADAEIRGGIADLAQATGSTDPAFAYPAGAHDAATVDLVRAAGIRVAFTTRPGTNDLAAADWLRLRRFNVGVGTPAAATLARALR